MRTLHNYSNCFAVKQKGTLMDTATNNIESIEHRYTFARETVEQERTYLANIYAQEQEKEEPCPVFSEYLDTQMKNLTVFLEKFSLEDTTAANSILRGGAISRIISPHDPDPAIDQLCASFPSDDPAMPSVIARKCINEESARLLVEGVQEKRKDMPSVVLMELFDTQILTLIAFNQNLFPKNTAAIDAILNKNRLFSAQPVVQPQGSENT